MNNSQLSRIFLILLINILFFYKLLEAQDDYQKWLLKIKQEALEQGITEKTYFDSIRDLKILNNRVLSYYNNQPEFKITFNKYYNRNISSKRIDKGKKLLKKHSNLLKKINSSFNIPPEIVVAIWGIETNYGSYTGGFKVLESLSTLAYASKRKNFFKKEFFNAIKIIDKGLISKELLIGSWAGAMGQSQFMPSSYLNYAYDYSGDKKTDIWNTESDIFASISNYLKKHGWVKKEPWCYEIKKEKIKGIKDFEIKKLDFLSISKNKLLEDSILEPYKKSIVGKIKIVGQNNNERYFIVFRNFEIIKKYNNSDFYALTVGELANKINIR